MVERKANTLVSMVLDLADPHLEKIMKDYGLSKITDSELGYTITQIWEKYPVFSNSIISLLSLLIQRIPRHGSALRETLVGLLEKLPHELKRQLDPNNDRNIVAGKNNKSPKSILLHNDVTPESRSNILRWINRLSDNNRKIVYDNMANWSADEINNLSSLEDEEKEAFFSFPKPEKSFEEKYPETTKTLNRFLKRLSEK